MNECQERRHIQYYIEVTGKEDQDHNHIAFASLEASVLLQSTHHIFFFFAAQQLEKPKREEVYTRKNSIEGISSEQQFNKSLLLPSFTATIF
jgi:hypothetical protein